MANYPQTTATENQNDVTLTTTGKVGIGTITPDSKLHVYHTGSILRSNVEVGDNNEVNLGIKRTGASYPSTWEAYIPQSATDLRLYNGGDRVAFLANGNVGINTTTPQAKLDISGKIMISDSTNPAPPAVGVIIYFDGTNLKARRYDGKTANMTVSWA